MDTSYRVRDISLAPSGAEKIMWVSRFMPVLRRIGERFREEKPLEGLRVAACLHVEMKTAFLALTLQQAGAEVSLAASNPLTTQDDVAAALAEEGVRVFAWRGETEEEYFENIDRALDLRPDLVIDDGADMIARLHSHRTELLDGVMGATEETTTGVIRLRAMEREGVLRIPVVAVNDALCKYLFDNRYGTGQSTWDGIMRATNLLIAGKSVVVAGYGWVGRGIAMRARGLGARVIVTEVDPIRALEAAMDGFEVMPMSEAAKVGDIFVTATGDVDVITAEHFKVMKDGAILANAGHFNVEVSVEGLESAAARKRQVRPCVTEYEMPDGRRLYLLGEGRLVNLVCADGHPAEIMDMSFSLQALAVEYLARRWRDLSPGVHLLPREIDERVARIKLESMGIQIDELTEEQRRYIESWKL
ncbi:MAG TPA: adenosylhomocysteinase [Candidatus Korarchaeota archaeon]|nr:adenosylhomocysteinase [Candidatus Korarchaeota archaeon]